ncbi:polyamine aminopropyltransferase [Paenibacillus qinlingensis]|uniref:Polyamine aminopropyltransferase n=1 Tax=Paenibacillus qinlingensis TaxID=1837343 RepID=A0ABU1P5G5_9BACL|nr:polyamine aminopropyltransferase [Paenibacillus qinlingensis]MDR6554995.1 spermidine synthase [Paenibacillus qinlingensis]
MTNRKSSLTGYYKETNEELWLWDDIPELDMEVGYKVEALLYYEQSPFQEISIVDTKGFGRMLVLDGTPQVTTKDGFIYNEMITHIAMTTHNEPKRVAMIGGGDCGPSREALKYESVGQIDVVEIDQRVVDVCRAWMTKEGSHEREGCIRMIYRDGYKWIQEQKKNLDVLLVDRSDPYGPATSLYKQQFYQYVYNSLTDDGIVVFQSGSPYYNQSIFRNTVQSLSKLFPIVHPYLCTIPTFPGGIWSFVIASKKWDPLEADLSHLQWQDTKYIDPETFKASFVLPSYIKNILHGKK